MVSSDIGYSRDLSQKLYYFMPLKCIVPKGHKSTTQIYYKRDTNLLLRVILSEKRIRGRHALNQFHTLRRDAYSGVGARWTVQQNKRINSDFLHYIYIQMLRCTTLPDTSIGCNLHIIVIFAVSFFLATIHDQSQSLHLGWGLFILWA